MQGRAGARARELVAGGDAGAGAAGSDWACTSELSRASTAGASSGERRGRAGNSKRMVNHRDIGSGLDSNTKPMPR